MTLILKEQYGALTAEVHTTGLLNPSYEVQLYVTDDGNRQLVWEQGFTESTSPYPRGIELALAGFILRSKTGLWVTDQPDPSDYERMRVITHEITSSTEFAIRFNSSKPVTGAVMHHGETYGSTGKVNIIGKQVRLDISCTIVGDGLGEYPTYTVTCTAPASEKLVMREGYQATATVRSCTFIVKRNQLRFDDEEFAREYKEELIVALGLEGKPE